MTATATESSKIAAMGLLHAKACMVPRPNVKFLHTEQVLLEFGLFSPSPFATHLMAASCATNPSA